MATENEAVLHAVCLHLTSLVIDVNAVLWRLAAEIPKLEPIVKEKLDAIQEEITATLNELDKFDWGS
jgi:hypothetical protein